MKTLGFIRRFLFYTILSFVLAFVVELVKVVIVTNLLHMPAIHFASNDSRYETYVFETQINLLLFFVVFETLFLYFRVFKKSDKSLS